MIEGQNIVCIGNSNWFGNYAKSTVQILERLAKKNNILFVEYPYTIKDLIATLRGKQSVPTKRMLGIHKRLQQLDTNSGTKVFDLIIPPGLPVYFFKNEKLFNLFFKFNTWIYRRTVLKVMKKLNIENPILITAYNPFYGLAMHGTLNEKVHIYYCYDGVEAGFFGERIFRFEDELSKKVRTIITTSEHLLTTKLPLNPNSFVVKNGVDFPVFSQFSKQSVSHRKRKKVGFIGSLDQRFDIETVEYIIINLPDFDFEFTGDTRNEVPKARLRKYPNVSFFDSIKPNDVPELLSKYDVGIIPYLVNEVNKNIYPLKINEFLAVGVPVVMTAFADLPDFVGLVSVCTDKDDFVRKIVSEVENDNVQNIQKRIDFAATNSWEERTESFSRILENFI